jgi:CheY-like chemotaxis protein
MERLKNDIALRHVPVCVISTEEVARRAVSYGAIRALTKPFQSKGMLEQALDAIFEFAIRRTKELVVLSQDPGRFKEIADFIRTGDVQMTRAETGSAALDLLDRKGADCLVLDRAPDDMSIEAFVEALGANGTVPAPPVILYADEPLPEFDGQSFPHNPPAANFRQVTTLARLLDQTAFFLHTPVSKMPEPKRRTVEQLYQSDQVLSGKKALIVDDDIRNIFSLTSVLEWRNMVVVSSETGRDAIRILQSEPDIDIVLMDIMMPEMDGLDTMRVIRKLPQFNALPIIAVTAKAMKGDREKCIEAGAWDYLSKPVDTEQLLAVLRVWLHRLNDRAGIYEPVGNLTV